MNFINFSGEFNKVAISNGMGNAIYAITVCQIARAVMKDKMPEGSYSVKSFSMNTLFIGFSDSVALAKFSLKKGKFEEEFRYKCKEGLPMGNAIFKPSFKYLVEENLSNLRNE